MYLLILTLLNCLMVLLFLIWLSLLLFHKRLPEKEFYPPISVLIPVYNEKDHLQRMLDSLGNVDYPGEMEVIVIDDGSTDGSTEGLESRESDYHLKVIRREHHGKCSALNAGLEEAEHEHLIVTDADVMVSSQAVEKVVSRLEDEEVGLVSGKVRVMKESGPLGWFQSVEYALTSALLYAHTYFGISLPFVYGAFSAMRKSALQELGGFQCGTLIEDSDTHVSLLEAGYKVVGADAVVLTEPCHSWKELFQQRLRWMKGGIQLFFKHFRSFGSGISLSYMLLLFLLWPVGTFITWSFNLPGFVRWLRPDIFFLVPYVINWYTFVGPVTGVFQLAEWGFKPDAVTGISTGILSLLVVGLAQLRQNEDFGLGEFIAFICFPLYGWVFMAVVGLTAMLSFVFDLLTGRISVH